MTRKSAAERHTGSAPPPDAHWPAEGIALIDALLAVHHPVRRRIYEVLTVNGPATVGALATRLDLAPGSVSHHLKPLHSAGFVQPAPELARDTRQSWWRGIRRRMSWSGDDFTEGSFARQVTDAAEWANLRHLDEATLRWMRTRDQLPDRWRHGQISDTFAAATAQQMHDLNERVAAVTRQWSEQVLADAREQPDVERRPVRFIARVFPSDPAAEEGQT